MPKLNSKRKPSPGKVLCLIQVANQWVWSENDREKTAPAATRVLGDGTVKATIHAEMRAIKLAQRNGGPIRAVMVLRARKNGTLGMAKPCNYCMEKLLQSGVRARDIFYSNTNGIIVNMTDDKEMSLA